MNKKLLGILLVLIAVVAIGTVVAASETVEIEGFEFTVPDGFTEDPTYETVNVVKEQNGVTFTSNGKLYQNDDGDVVNVLVAEYDGVEVTDDVAAGLGGDAKTIAGIDGYVIPNGTLTSFEFPNDGNLVVLSTNNEDILEDFLTVE